MKKHGALFSLLMMMFCWMALAGVKAQDPIRTAQVAWSPDGTMLAVGSGTEVQLLDADTLQVLNTIAGLDEQHTETKWSPDGTRLAVTNGPDVEIWSQPWQPGQATKLVTYQYYADLTPPVPEVSVTDSVWSPNGATIVTAIGEIMDVWDTTTGLRLNRITGPWLRVTDLLWSVDNRLAMANVDSYVTILDPETAAETNLYHTSGAIPSPGAWSMAFSPDGNQMAVGTAEDGAVLIWGDTRSSEEVTELAAHVLCCHSDYVLTLSWSTTNLIASGSRDGTIKIWNATTGETLQTINVGQNVRVNSLAFSPDGTKLAYGKPDGSVGLVEMPTATVPSVTLPAETPYIAWSPDGRMLAVGLGTEVRILDAETLEPLNTLTGLEKQRAEAAWSPDGQQLAVVSFADVELWQQPWSPTTAQRVLSYAYYSDSTPPQPSVGVDAVVWSPDGQRIASSAGSSLDIWNAISGSRIRLVTGDWDRIPDIAWSLDNRLALANVSSYALNVDPNSGDLINYYYATSSYGLPPGFWSTAWSPTGDAMAIGNGDGLILIWGDTRTSERAVMNPARVLAGHTDYVLSLVWSSTGDYIASGSVDGTVRLWDAATGEAVQVIEVGQGVEVNSVAFSPDGTKLAYGKPDGSVVVLDVPLNESGGS